MPLKVIFPGPVSEPIQPRNTVTPPVLLASRWFLSATSTVKVRIPVPWKAPAGKTMGRTASGNASPGIEALGRLSKT